MNGEVVKYAVVRCEEIRERMPEVAAGFGELTADDSKHLETCSACAGQLQAMRKTMAVLEEWQVPEPSPYFDVRLQARLREEMARPRGWGYWLRRPVLAAALTVLMGVGVGLYFARGSYRANDDVARTDNMAVEPGTAVSDLQALEKNHEMYSDFELLDDLTVQQDVTANP